MYPSGTNISVTYTSNISPFLYPFSIGKGKKGMNENGENGRKEEEKVEKENKQTRE